MIGDERRVKDFNITRVAMCKQGDRLMDQFTELENHLGRNDLSTLETEMPLKTR